MTWCIWRAATWPRDVSDYAEAKLRAASRRSHPAGHAKARNRVLVPENMATRNIVKAPKQRKRKQTGCFQAVCCQASWFGDLFFPWLFQGCIPDSLSHLLSVSCYSIGIGKMKKNASCALACLKYLHLWLSYLSCEHRTVELAPYKTAKFIKKKKAKQRKETRRLSCDRLDRFTPTREKFEMSTLWVTSVEGERTKGCSLWGDRRLRRSHVDRWEINLMLIRRPQKGTSPRISDGFRKLCNTTCEIKACRRSRFNGLGESWPPSY